MEKHKGGYRLDALLPEDERKAGEKRAKCHLPRLALRPRRGRVQDDQGAHDVAETLQYCLGGWG